MGVGILRALVETNAVPFQPIGSLSDDLIPTAMQVTNFCGKFLIFDGNKRYFNWTGFLLAVGVESAKGKISSDRLSTWRLSQQNQSVWSLVQGISSWLGNEFNVSMDTTQLSAVIENTFTNLKEVSHNCGFLDFDSSHELANSSWEYRVLFALPVAGRPDHFQVLVVTILIWANIVEKSTWWGLHRWTEKNFGADIMGVVLGVERGFRNPN